MSDVRTLHNRAMRMMDKALAARKEGDVVNEYRFTRSAAYAELRAAAIAAEGRASMTTVAILARSANAIIDHVVALETEPPAEARR
jgi:hypothetical protein